MKKILSLSLFLHVLIQPAFAAENVTVQSKPEGIAQVPAAKPGATPDTLPQPVQNQKSATQEKISLETAYKREYAFLEAQKRELTERLKKYQSSSRSEEQTLSNKISILERASVDRSAKIDQLNMLLAEAERKEAAATERNDSLELTYSQAEATLKNHGREMPTSLKESTGNDPAKVGYVFRQALALIQNQGKIQTKKGQFFLENGKQTEGDIIQIGNIAAYGVSAEGSGSLIPVGGDDFKIWKEFTADSAIALSKNQQPDLLKLFLFESRTQAIDETAEKTIMGVIHSGGIIGWIIVSLGAFTILLVLVRIYLLWTNSSNTRQLSDRIIQQIVESNLDTAKKSCGNDSSAIGRVLANTLRHLKDDRDHMESVVHEAILQESGPLDRFGSAILVIASVSPLLGLLGTVTGMIATFDVITEFGTGDPKLLSGGISIALVTTELGLIVAIPALLAGSLLSAWARNIKRDLEHTALRVTNAFFGRPQPEPLAALAAGSTALALNDPANQETV